jgi:protein phosphatase
MKIAFAALTDVGLVRQNNEDSYFICDVVRGTRHTPPPASGEGTAETNGQGVLVAVADGMGGALAGEVASRMAMEELGRVAEALKGVADADAARTLVGEGILRANRAIFEASTNDPELRGMGTTLTVALLREGRVYWFQVGDSKGLQYESRSSVLHVRTKDQSLIGKLIEDKVISAEDAEQLEGGRNIILQALGAEATVRPEESTSDLHEGDKVILCTDGLHGCVRVRELQEFVQESADAGKLCEDLVRSARDRGGPDNITVVTVTVLETEDEDRPPGLLGRVAGLFRRRR